MEFENEKITLKSSCRKAGKIIIICYTSLLAVTGIALQIFIPEGNRSALFLMIAIKLLFVVTLGFAGIAIGYLIQIKKIKKELSKK